MWKLPRMLYAIAAGLASLCAIPAIAQDDTDTIEWLDNYEQAIQEAKRTRKPIFLEFRCEA